MVFGPFWDMPDPRSQLKSSELQALQASLKKLQPEAQRLALEEAPHLLY